MRARVRTRGRLPPRERGRCAREGNLLPAPARPVRAPLYGRDLPQSVDWSRAGCNQRARRARAGVQARAGAAATTGWGAFFVARGATVAVRESPPFPPPPRLSLSLSLPLRPRISLTCEKAALRAAQGVTQVPSDRWEAASSFTWSVLEKRSQRCERRERGERACASGFSRVRPGLAGAAIRPGRPARDPLRPGQQGWTPHRRGDRARCGGGRAGGRGRKARPRASGGTTLLRKKNKGFWSLTSTSMLRRTRRMDRVDFSAGRQATESSSPASSGSSSSNRPDVISRSTVFSRAAKPRAAGGRAVGANSADARTAAGTESPHEPSSASRTQARPVG